MVIVFFFEFAELTWNEQKLATIRPVADCLPSEALADRVDSPINHPMRQLCGRATYNVDGE